MISAVILRIISDYSTPTMCLCCQILLTHGLCHLLGYDHATEEQWKQMFQQELHVLEEYSKLTGLKLRPITTIGH